MKKLLEQALVSKDAPKAKLGRPRKDKTRGGGVTGRKESGRLAEDKEAKVEMNSMPERSWSVFQTWTLRSENAK
jgi:hypothetical protein